MKGKAVKGLIIYLFVFFSFSFSFAQKESYLPLNIRPAYEKGTRSFDGKPGPNYWQNHSVYKIKASLDPRFKILRGSEEIVYYNESPDSLNLIVIRLYQNINKPTARRDFNIDEKAITDGVILRRISIRDKDVEVNGNPNARVSGTNLFLKLGKKLPPKHSIQLAFDWEFKIPEVQTMRFGSFDSTSMFVAYWYPQVSVYDDIDGWDRMDYSGTLEMYNDFADFDVQFYVPANFQIWSTGVWQNPDKILNDKYLNRYNQA